MRASDSISVYGLELLPHERVALVKGQPIELTAREFDILMHLGAHPGWVYSAEQLADGEEDSADSSPDSVRVHIAHLRHKLTEAGSCGAIGTVRGVGYRLQRGARDEPGTGVAGSPTDTASAEDAERAISRRLRDSFWLLERAVVALEQSATDEQVRAASDALDAARRALTELMDD